MTAIHDLNGVPIESALAERLDNGKVLLFELVETGRSRLELSHLLAAFARSDGSMLRSRVLDPMKVTPDSFCRAVYLTPWTDPDGGGFPPLALTPETLSPEVRACFGDFGSLIRERNLKQGTEPLLLLALIRRVGPEIREQLAAILGGADRVQSLIDHLGRQSAVAVEAPHIFDPATGELNHRLFDKTGRLTIDRLREETAGLGYDRCTELHLLFALVGIENGVLARGLLSQSIDPVTEIHTRLLKELRRPGKKRVTNLTLTRTSLYPSVCACFETAYALAQNDDTGITELHIVRALVVMRNGLAASFLRGYRVNLDHLVEYLQNHEVEVEEVEEESPVPIDRIESELRDCILGQEAAIRQILPWIKRLRFGHPKERGPAAVLLFLGPSGTGKTQLAKELARVVYGSENELLILEMGQFATRESINQFIGAPPGYVGYGEGKLTNGLRDHPKCVVLFDEVEKANADVWVALLRFLDEGLIEDPAGPTRDGRHCIVVMTSNLGGEEFARVLGDGRDGSDSLEEAALESVIKKVVMPYFKLPEIYNRVDGKVVFLPLTDGTYETLVRREVDREVEKFRALHGIDLRVDPAVIDWLGHLAKEKRSEGARSVPRLINQHVIGPVIDWVTGDSGGSSSISLVLRADRSTTEVRIEGIARR